MKISIEQIVEIITREVVKELLKKGIEVDFNIDKSASQGSKNTSVEIDMSDYKTPVITEDRLMSLSFDVTEVIIPNGTIITPGARDVIKKKKLNITYKNKSN